MRYVAFLRGVSPMNLQMADLQRCLEATGFTEVKTVRSSGNVAFTARKQSRAALERKIETAMAQQRVFYTIVRTQEELERIIAADPFATFDLPANAKRLVTFARKLKQPATWPGRRSDVAILCANEREAYSMYVPGPNAVEFMALIEKTFGREVTTRTWETVPKCARA
ncbi:MAG: DUF1697 domain-containing protein [Verrucomicrobiota bacterium]|nr:DUF1697 domain-containing protein [Verrucomicrobiota bacterium]